MKVRFALGYVPKSQALIELDGTTVLQPGRQGHLLALGMSLIHRGPQKTRADALALMGWLDLDFPDLQRVGVLEELNHAHTLAINFDGKNIALIPAFSAVSQMARLVPTTPGGDEELLIARPAKLFEPGLVVFGSWN